MDKRPEQQPQLPRREIPLGRWFEPLREYDSIPYSHFREGYRAKAVEFTTPGIGNWSVDVDWYNEDRVQAEQMGHTRDGKVLIVLLREELIVPENEVITHQMQSEVALLNVGLSLPDRLDEYSTDEFNNNPPPYKAFTRLPSGLLLWKGFSNIMQWNKGQEEITELLVPDTPFMMEQLEVMIERE